VNGRSCCVIPAYPEIELNWCAQGIKRLAQRLLPETLRRRISQVFDAAGADMIRGEMIRLLPRLRAFARSLMAAPNQIEDADDLVQQTCEKGLRNLSAYTPGTRLDAWLFQIMRNTWIDGHRAHRPTVPIDAAETGLENSSIVGEDGRNTTEARLHLAQVHRAMMTLTEDQRSVLMLVCVEGMKYREVAEALGIPDGTVMSRLARARLALAEALRKGPHQAEPQKDLVR
jgi:RNA polymerase sigma-70 factor, ECF subfamily